MTLIPGMGPRWTVAGLAVAVAVLLGGQQLAGADALTSTADTPPSSATPAATTATGPVPTASASSSADPASSTPTPASAVFDQRCAGRADQQHVTERRSDCLLAGAQRRTHFHVQL